MFCYVWEYEVAPENADAFVAAYGPDGPWVRLFRRDPAYLGTELHRDVANPRRFLTIDRWTSRQSCLAFRERTREEFDAIDAECERLTVRERAIGDFDLLAEAEATPGSGRSPGPAARRWSIESIGERIEAAWRARREGRPAEAEEDLLRAVALARGGGGRADLVRALGALAQVVRDRGERERALGLSQEAVALCRQPVDPLLLAHTVRHLGDVQRELGRVAEAQASYDEALALYRAAPDAPALDFANALRAAAVLADTVGETETARTQWSEAGRLYRRAGVREGVEESERRRTGSPTKAG